MPQSDSALQKVIAYMQAHWPSEVKSEWRVELPEYQAVAERILANIAAGKTKERHLTRIAGLSGSGKTTQLLPAVEACYDKQDLRPVLVAARIFAPYHPYYQQISDHYGAENVRRLTDEFSTIMMFLVLSALTKRGYDIILDVTLLDPAIEGILLKMLAAGDYQHSIVMIAASPAVTEQHLAGRAWRHSRATEQEFIRATVAALAFYAETSPTTRIVLWNTYTADPVYDGPVRGSLADFERESGQDSVPPHDEAVLRAAKLAYLAQNVL